MQYTHSMPDTIHTCMLDTVHIPPTTTHRDDTQLDEVVGQLGGVAYIVDRFFTMYEV